MQFAATMTSAYSYWLAVGSIHIHRSTIFLFVSLQSLFLFCSSHRWYKVYTQKRKTELEINDSQQNNKQSHANWLKGFTRNVSWSAKQSPFNGRSAAMKWSSWIIDISKARSIAFQNPFHVSRKIQTVFPSQFITPKNVNGICNLSSIRNCSTKFLYNFRHV